MTDEGVLKPITREEFCARFKAQMLKRVAPHTEFTDGGSIAEYADEVAPTYFDDENNGAPFMETPEDCANTDISYWED